MSCTTHPALTAGGWAGTAEAAAGGACAGAGCVDSGDPPHDASATARVKAMKNIRIGALLLKSTAPMIIRHRDRAAREMKTHAAEARRWALTRLCRATRRASPRLSMRQTLRRRRGWRWRG